MSVLSHVFERAGLATVGLALIRGQAETVSPPRSLYVEFPLGRPLGRPNDPEFQHQVIGRALSLVERTDTPFIEDFGVVIEDEADEPDSCPLPPRFDPSLPPAIDEVRGLRKAYDRALEAHDGRTALGRVAADADGIEDLVRIFLRIEAGESLADVGWSDTDGIAAGQDVRAYYEEAGTQLADNVTGARKLESWFYQVTQTGQMILRAREAAKADESHQLFTQYVAPLSQR